MPINHAYDVVSRAQAVLFRELYKLNPNWLRMTRESALVVLPKEREDELKQKLVHSNIDAMLCLMPHVAYGFSQWVGAGSKIFRPSALQLESMRHMDVKIKATDYKQAYPSILIDFPNGHEIKYVLSSVGSWVEDDCQFLNLFILPNDGERLPKCSYRCIGLHPSADFEEVFGETTPEGAPSNDWFRAVVNLNLLMTHFDVKSAPLHAKEFEQNRLLINADGEKGERARERAASDLRLVEFSQEIEMFRTSAPRVDLGGSHASPAPHWRRGHWRMQACGKRFEDRKRVFIPPVLVMANCFVGDLADTSVVYTESDN